MTRRLRYKIEEQDANKTIGDFLREKGYSRAVIIQLKKDENGIRKNGMWAGVNENLKSQDTLDICLKETKASEKIVPIQTTLDILYEDEDILVINKPHNMPIHPSVNNYDNTLANAVTGYFKNKEREYVFRCINRLDRDTTGITIIAKNLLSSSILSKSIEKREISRIYIAFVEGDIKKKGTISLPIARMQDSLIKRKVDEKHGKYAVTHYIKLDTFYIENKIVSIVALKLETGRTHQIRVHMAAIGHPLIGDFLYNESNHVLTRQALHAAQCSFKHPITKENMCITAPFYEDMKKLIPASKEVYFNLNALSFKLKNLTW